MAPIRPGEIVTEMNGTGTSDRTTTVRQTQ